MSIKTNIDLAIQLGSAKIVQKTLSDTFVNPFPSDGQGGFNSPNAPKVKNDPFNEVGWEQSSLGDNPAIQDTDNNSTF